ncbi:DUF262 domain-containing protein [Cloacibacterium sp.]|uniref:DUF262 domain-containing protein n=1 Tax=Cloacibacterium sp. TaxID=1913682 RepID=UPI0039E47DBB
MRTTLWNLLTNNIPDHSIKFGVVIPMIQRDYAQGRSNPKSLEIRNQFISDLKVAIENSKKEEEYPLELDFVYGYIQNDIFYPLDGQQRLTTLFLLHWYLSFKEDDLKLTSPTLSKFTYQIRQTSKDFFRKLLELDFDKEKFDDPEFILSTYIKNQSWFLSKWITDNTIFSCLNVLDLIHEKFKKADILLADLTSNDKTPIVFNFLDIEKLGMSDDLYIKMNARGVSLTSFENLKAELSKLIKESKFNEKHIYNYEHSEGVSKFDMYKYFITKIDTVWSDYFWNKRDINTNIFDNKLLNLLSYIALTNKAAVDPEDFEQIRNKFEAKKILPTFYQFIESKLLDEESLVNYIDILDFLIKSDSSYIEYFDQNNPYLDVEDLLDTSVYNGVYTLSATDRLKVYSIVHFLPLLKERDNASSELLKMTRLISNLSTVSNFYNNYKDLNTSLVGLSTIFRNYTGDIYSQFLNSEISGFYKDQVIEEKIKIILLSKSKEWSQLIQKIELDPYLNGHILVMLKFSGIWDEYKSNTSLEWDTTQDLQFFESLKDYYAKYNMYFSEKGSIDFGNQLFRTAMLSINDYLIHATNFHFISDDNHRDTSWKRLFRESDNEKFAKSIGTLKTLFDSSDLNIAPKTNLKNVIKSNKTNVSDWRKYFISNPDLLYYQSGYVWLDNNYKMIYLLNASKYSVKAYELRTLLLQRKLADLDISTIIEYKQEYGKSIITQIGSRKSKVIFSFDKKDTFEIIERGKGSTIFNSEKKIIDYIEENYKK